ncbi:MAG TPA: phosphoribosylanthranilate isomerase [Vicinamibacterales bacterium]
MFIKVCGITRLTDALHAVQQGATALGFVFWPHSPRFVTPERAAEIIAELPSSIVTVGVFVNEPVDGIRDVAGRTRITTVQLHGDEPPVYADALDWPVMRSLTLDEADDVCDAWPAETVFLVDAIDPVRRGGTGGVVDWVRAADVARERRVVLAGGLTPENVADAIAAVRPFGVDVSSGVEQSPGAKDFVKVARFVANARSAFEER